MKKIIIGLVAVVGLAGCNTFNDPSQDPSSIDLAKAETVEHSSEDGENSKGSLDIIPSEVFKNIDELAKRSSLVIVGQVKTDSKSFEYNSVTFFESKIQAKDIYRDENHGLKKNETITLLQNDIEEIDPLVKKGEKVLLFLNRYEGPVIDNAYRIVGLYQGHFKVDGAGNLRSVGNKNEHKMQSATTSDLSSLDKVLEQNPYVAEKNIRLTDEEIQALNEIEEKLLEESQKNNQEESN